MPKTKPKRVVVTKAMIEVALDEFYPGPWRGLETETDDRNAMDRAIRAALKAGRS